MVAPVSVAIPFVATTVIRILYFFESTVAMIDIMMLLAFLQSHASGTIGGNRRVHELPEQVVGDLAIVVKV
jgi:hypothetical protein